MLKKVLSLVWLGFCFIGIIGNWTKYNIFDFIIVIIVTILPFLIYKIISKNKGMKKNNIKDQSDIDISCVSATNDTQETVIKTTKPEYDTISKSSQTESQQHKTTSLSIIAKKLLVKFCIGLCCFTLLTVVVAIIVSPHSTVPKSIFATELQLNQEQRAEMLDIFEQCGIGEITNVNPIQQAETRSSYWLTDVETEFYGKGGDYAIVVWVNNETKAIEEIYFHDQTIYIDGNVIAPITSYYVNKEDRNNYRVQAQLTIEPLLSYPKTAKFPASKGWKFDIVDGIVIAQSSVEAQNAFGVKADLPFKIKFLNENVIYLNLNGTEYTN